MPQILFKTRLSYSSPKLVLSKRESFLSVLMCTCIFFLPSVFHFSSCVLLSGHLGFHITDLCSLPLGSRVHPTPFAVCPQHPFAVHRRSLKSAGWYLVRKLCSTEVSRRLLNSVSCSCCLHGNPEASACRAGLGRTLNRSKVSLVLQAELREGSGLYLYLHVKDADAWLALLGTSVLTCKRPRIWSSDITL